MNVIFYTANTYVNTSCCVYYFPNVRMKPVDVFSPYSWTCCLDMEYQVYVDFR